MCPASAKRRRSISRVSSEGSKTKGAAGPDAGPDSGADAAVGDQEDNEDEDEEDTELNRPSWSHSR